jgi:hypothetical protein
MEGSVSPSSSLFEAGTEYRRLHAIALQNRPEVDLQNEEFAIAFLQHDKSSDAAVSSDYLWFKVKAVSSRTLMSKSMLIVSRNTLSPKSKVPTKSEPESRSISSSHTNQLVTEFK